MSKLLCIASVLVLALCYAQAQDAICPCPRIMAPVCGTDGRTYTNKCELTCAQKTRTDLRVAYEGKCKAVVAIDEPEKQEPELEPCFCTFEYRQVCASNGKTYDNPCLLNCVAKQRTDLKMLHEGPCKGSDRSIA